MSQYVCAGMLPGRVPVRALELPEWDLHFVITSGELLRRPGEFQQRARTELLRILHKRLRRVRPAYHVLLDY